MTWRDWLVIAILIFMPIIAGALLGQIIADCLELRDLKRGCSWLQQQNITRLDHGEMTPMFKEVTR